MKRSLYPAQEEIEARRVRESIELCGKNRGPHDYIPIEKVTQSDDKCRTSIERVTRFLCRICFNTVDTSTLISMYKDLSHLENRGIS